MVNLRYRWERKGHYSSVTCTVAFQINQSCIQIMAWETRTGPLVKSFRARHQIRRILGRGQVNPTSRYPSAYFEINLAIRAKKKRLICVRNHQNNAQRFLTRIKPTSTGNKIYKRAIEIAKAWKNSLVLFENEVRATRRPISLILSRSHTTHPHLTSNHHRIRKIFFIRSFKTRFRLFFYRLE